MRKKRLPEAGERVKVGHRVLTLPGVRSMTDLDSATPATKPDDGEQKKPTDGLSEELTRTIKAAYQ
jgi:hypothetical protein